MKEISPGERAVFYANVNTFFGTSNIFFFSLLSFWNTFRYSRLYAKIGC